MIRGSTMLRAGEGVRLHQGDILESANPGFAQLELETRHVGFMPYRRLSLGNRMCTESAKSCPLEAGAASRGRAPFSGSLAPPPHPDRPFSCDEFIHLIAVGSVAAEFPVVEQALDTAFEAHLIRMVALSDWPTHSFVPAAAQEECRRSAHSGSEQAERPSPSRPALFLVANRGHAAAIWYTESMLHQTA